MAFLCHVNERETKNILFSQAKYDTFQSENTMEMWGGGMCFGVDDGISDTSFS